MGGPTYNNANKNIKESIASAPFAQLIKPHDQMVTNFIAEFQFSNTGTGRQNGLVLITCMKLLSTFMDLLKLKDQLLKDFNKKTEICKSEIRKYNQLHGQGNVEYYEKAKGELNASWVELGSVMKVQIKPRLTQLEKDLKYYWNSCTRFMDTFISNPRRVIAGMEEIIFLTHDQIMPLMKSTFVGIQVLQVHLEEFGKPVDIDKFRQLVMETFREVSVSMW